MPYLITTKNLESLLNSIISAKPPERFTTKFLCDLGFTSTNDRLYTAMLKALGFLDDNSSPTQRYYAFLDQSMSRKILASGIKEAYEDLFNININAQNMSIDELKNKFRTLTQGQKSDKIISFMATTFNADWTQEKPSKKPEQVVQEVKNVQVVTPQQTKDNSAPQLHYNIQIHLPETRDMAVYDSIFQSLRRHLL